MSRRVDPYECLLRASAAVAMPSSFMTDLTKHDRLSIAERGSSVPFAWIVWASGTGLVFRDAKTAPQVARAYVETMEGTLCFWWDGERLKQVHADDLPALFETE